MDTLAHGLWGGMAAGWKRRFGLAFAFGVGPDLCSFGALMAVRIIQGTFTPGKPSLAGLPDWLFTAYDFSHSLIIAGAVWLVLWFTAREISIPFLAWPLHILCDIPVHTRDYFPTPFLFPISDYTWDGFSWGQRWFMILNYSCLLAMAAAWVYFRHRRRSARRTRGRLFMLKDPPAGKSQSSQPEDSSRSA